LDLLATVLRPAYFMQNDLRQKDALNNLSVYGMPIGDKGLSMVDVQDMGEAAAECSGYVRCTPNLDPSRTEAAASALPLFSSAKRISSVGLNYINSTAFDFSHMKVPSRFTWVLTRSMDSCSLHVQLS